MRSIANRLAMIPAASGVALVVRHAEREEIPAGAFGSEAALTPHGVEAAEHLGAVLRVRERAEIVSSPVHRCVQTAAAILHGSGWPGQISLDPLLGEPGPFVVDPEVSGPLFLDASIRELARRQLSEAKPLPGMRPTEEGVRMLLRRTTGNLGQCGFLNVYVTHDVILAVLVASLFRLPLEETGWPGYLDGLLLWRSDGRLHSSWKCLRQASHPGLNAKVSTPASCSHRVLMCAPVVASHNRMLSSSLPLASILPSGLNARLIR